MFFWLVEKSFQRFVLGYSTDFVVLCSKIKRALLHFQQQLCLLTDITPHLSHITAFSLKRTVEGWVVVSCMMVEGKCCGWVVGGRGGWR